MTYEVQTYTICEGWTNCWTVDDKPQTFDTIQEAQSELDELFNDMASEIKAGERAADETYDSADYRIVAVSLSTNLNIPTLTLSERNDHFRKTLLFGKVLITQGISALSDDDNTRVINAVTQFNNFTEENDPNGEHDFGSIDLDHLPRIFWKIDYYDRNNQNMGSSDPTDPAKTLRVLTIMLASEY